MASLARFDGICVGFVSIINSDISFAKKEVENCTIARFREKVKLLGASVSVSVWLRSALGVRFLKGRDRILVCLGIILVFVQGFSDFTEDVPHGCGFVDRNFSVRKVLRTI